MDCVFYPKFHCEFSPIEMFWCAHKKFVRARTTGKIDTLRKIVPEGLKAICQESVRRFFAHCRRWEEAFRKYSIMPEQNDRLSFIERAVLSGAHALQKKVAHLQTHQYKSHRNTGGFGSLPACDEDMEIEENSEMSEKDKAMLGMRKLLAHMVCYCTPCINKRDPPAEGAKPKHTSECLCGKDERHQ
jgi:hypothetical protein